MKSMILAWTAKGMTFPGMKALSCLSRAVCGALQKVGSTPHPSAGPAALSPA